METTGAVESSVEDFDGTSGSGDWVADGAISVDEVATAEVVAGRLEIAGGEGENLSSMWSRELTIADREAGNLTVKLFPGVQAPADDDTLTIAVTDAASPANTVTTTVTGADVVAGSTATEPLVVGLDFTSLLPDAASVVVSISATRGTSEGAHGGFGVESVEAGLTDSETSTYVYDAAGRMTSRTVGSVTTDMGWDPLSNLTSTSTPADARLYAYDASGQRVAQIVVDEVSPDAVAEKVTAYVGDLEVTDADATATGVGLTATRFVTFGGATVATVTTGTPTPTWSLLLGDGQGSAQVAVELELDAVEEGTGLAPASAAHEVTRNAYLPFGATRGADQLATSRGWLGQVADTETGLIYLNARYYDPMLARFVSPDPLMNPGDPKTLDPYRYADNNPVMMTDASGLYSNVCNGLTGSAKYACDQSAGHYKPIGSKSGFTPGTGGSNAEGGGGGQRALPKKSGNSTPLSVPRSSGGTHTPFTPGPVVPQVDQLAETFLGNFADCAGDVSERLQCALRGVDSYHDANQKLRIDSMGRYYTPPGTTDFWKSVRTRLFGPDGRTAVAVGSHLDNAGGQLEAVGFALSAQDSVWHTQDLGADVVMGDTETAIYAVLRWGAGEVGGRVGQGYGTSLGMEAGGACGPQGAGVCGPIFAGIGSFVVGGLGDATGTAVFDHLLGGDAYLEWRSGQTRRIGLP